MPPLLARVTYEERFERLCYAVRVMQRHTGEAGEPPALEPVASEGGIGTMAAGWRPESGPAVAVIPAGRLDAAVHRAPGRFREEVERLRRTAPGLRIIFLHRSPPTRAILRFARQAGVQCVSLPSEDPTPLALAERLKRAFAGAFALDFLRALPAVFEEIFLRGPDLWRSIDERYIVKAVGNRRRDRLRARGRRPPRVPLEEVSLAAAAGVRPDVRLEHGEVEAQLRAALRPVHPRRATAWWLCAWRDWPGPEVTALFGCSTKAVERLRARCRERLQGSWGVG